MVSEDRRLILPRTAAPPLLSKVRSLCQYVSMLPIQELGAAAARRIRYVLMDIDDTLTREGKLLGSAYAALWVLKESGLVVVPVTGRPAGWCDLIARQWPVDGVVGENGALAFWEERPSRGRLPVLKQDFYPQAIPNDHPSLARIRDRALAEVPGLRVSKDQTYRRFDLALDFAEEDPVLPLSDALKVKAIAEAEGARAKVSSIHVNIWMGHYDKLSMAERFLSRRFAWDPIADIDQVVFVGDSPNDEPMFARFPYACAVANIHRYSGLIASLPAYVAGKECGDGFAEIAQALLERRS
jgi:HAD superfamily hydrolase (TIGR01484 family)